MAITSSDANPVMVRIGDKVFHCSCGANVFTKHDDVYRCNGCGEIYQGDPAAAGAVP